MNDIRNITEDRINKIVKGKEVDVPCQGFSIERNIGRTFIDDVVPPKLANTIALQVEMALKGCNA